LRTRPELTALLAYVGVAFSGYLTWVELFQISAIRQIARRDRIDPGAGAGGGRVAAALADDRASHSEGQADRMRRGAGIRGQPARRAA
jgi:hypothetical protein